MEQSFDRGKSAKYRQGEKGAVLVLSIFTITAILMVLALAVDGFNYVQSRMQLHHGAEYAAEAALREFITSSECCGKPSSDPASCRVSTEDSHASPQIQCQQRHAQARANLVANYQLVGGHFVQEIDVSEALQFGKWDNGTKAFNGSSSTINAVQLTLSSPHTASMLSHFVGIAGLNLSHSAIVFYQDPPDGLLYAYRPVR